MKVFDFNIHLPYLKSDNVNDVIAQDMSLDGEGIIKGLTLHKDELKKVNGGNFLLFNTRFFDENLADSVCSKLAAVTNEFYITNLTDFRRHDIADYIHRAKAAGAAAVMFNSYLQCIEEKDFKSVLETCKIAEQLGLIICIDGSYGTSKMYTYPNMKLACFIADYITKTKIVIVHSGGYNIINAMWLALDKENVWLDTSFSLPYYIGSSLEADFAFAYKKMNYQKVVFGSDHPYISFQQALDNHKSFFEKFAFPDIAIEAILYKNAYHLFNGY